MTRTAVAFKTLEFEHREVSQKFYEYIGPQPEVEFTDKLCAESCAPNFLLILDDDGEPLKSVTCYPDK